MASISLDGLKELTDRLKRLEVKIRRKVLRDAVFAAAKPVVEAAKASLRKHSETGLLAVAMARKAKLYRDGGAVAIAGPETGTKRARKGRVLTRKGRRFAEARRWPSKYAHLVEGGARPHRVGLGGRGRMHPGARPQPFLLPAFAKSQATCLLIVANVLSNALEDAGDY